MGRVGPRQVNRVRLDVGDSQGSGRGAGVGLDHQVGDDRAGLGAAVDIVAPAEHQLGHRGGVRILHRIVHDQIQMQSSVHEIDDVWIGG